MFRGMTVEHMVWFRFREDVSAVRRDEHTKGLKGLLGVVPGIIRLEVGENFTERALGCTLGLSVTLESRAALDAYQVHPSHVAVAQGLRADCDQILAFDFEHA